MKTSDNHFKYAAKLSLKISPTDPGLLLEALVSGSLFIEDTGVYKAMKEAQIVQRDHEAAKTARQETSPIECMRVIQKARMLLNPKHKLLRDHPVKDALAKVMTTAYVLIRYGMKEDKLEVKIKKIGEDFRMTERQIKKVVTGRLYNSVGT